MIVRKRKTKTRIENVVNKVVYAVGPMNAFPFCIVSTILGAGFVTMAIVATMRRPEMTEKVSRLAQSREHTSSTPITAACNAHPLILSAGLIAALISGKTISMACHSLNVGLGFMFVGETLVVCGAGKGLLYIVNKHEVLHTPSVCRIKDVCCPKRHTNTHTNSISMILDLIKFFAVSIPTTLVLTQHRPVLWIVAPLFVTKFLWNHIVKVVGDASDTPSSALSLFKLVKIISSCVALSVVYYGQETSVSLGTIKLVLSVNMFEAVLTDLQIKGRYGIFNSIAGIFLIAKLWDAQLEPIKPMGVFLFPIDAQWVIGYTLWNGAFVYGVGFAWSFVLVLMTPLVVSFSILEMPASWLGARTYSLVLNQALRGTQAYDIFVPDGNSFVTKKENADEMDQSVRALWGMINLIYVLVT